MSIIQEALKKVGSAGSDSQKAAKNPSKTILRPSFYLFIVFLALSYFGIRQFTHGTSGSATEVSYPTLLQTIYKPASSADAQTAETVQKTSAAKKERIGFPDFILSGIVQLINGPRAVINDMIVGVGDTVNGAIVHKINKNGVILKKEDSEIKLSME